MTHPENDGSDQGELSKYVPDGPQDFGIDGGPCRLRTDPALPPIAQSPILEGLLFVREDDEEIPDLYLSKPDTGTALVDAYIVSLDPSDDDADEADEYTRLMNRLWINDMRPGTLNELLALFAKMPTLWPFYTDAEESGILALGSIVEFDESIIVPVISMEHWREQVTPDVALDVVQYMHDEHCTMQDSLIDHGIAPSLYAVWLEKQNFGEFPVVLAVRDVEDD